MNELKRFDFYINFMDIDDYCFLIVEKYGEESKVVSALDAEYDRLIQSHNNCSDILFEIRKFLSDNGFHDIVIYADSVFAKTRTGRGKKNPYVPPSKRND